MAEQGYVVLAPDTYRSPSTAQIPRALYLRLSVSEEQVDSEMMLAFNYLISLPEVDSEHIAVIGFCYGGGVALRHGISNSEIDVTIEILSPMPVLLGHY
jgi:carboxymethylenebutenolidase